MRYSLRGRGRCPAAPVVVGPARAAVDSPERVERSEQAMAKKTYRYRVAVPAHIFVDVEFEEDFLPGVDSNKEVIEAAVNLIHDNSDTENGFSLNVLHHAFGRVYVDAEDGKALSEATIEDTTIVDDEEAEVVE